MINPDFFVICVIILLFFWLMIIPIFEDIRHKKGRILCLVTIENVEKKILVSAAKLPGDGCSMRCIASLHPKIWPEHNAFIWVELLNMQGKFIATRMK